MSSGKKPVAGKNEDMADDVELSGSFEGSEVKMSDVQDDDDEYSMTLNNEDDFQISTSFK